MAGRPRAAPDTDIVAPGPGAFSFAVIADLHLSEARPDGTPAGTARLQRCGQLLQALPAAERPDFVFLLGDIHLWSVEPEGLAGLGVPVHAVAGNHEHGRQRKEQLHALFPGDFRVEDQPADYYAFGHKGVRFIAVCDAAAGGDHVGHLSSQDIRPPGQYTWLEAELSRPEARKVLFAHIPPHPEAREDGMSMGPGDARWFNELLIRTAPTVLFCGHQHLPTREFGLGQTRVLVLRSAAWNFGQAPTGFLLARMGAAGLESTRELLLEG